MKTGACPDLDKLGRLLLGKLPDAERAGLGEHLLRCDDCATRAETISASDELTAALQAPLTLQGDEEVLSQAIKRACELRPKAETVETEETIVVVQREGDATSPQDSRRESAADEPPVDFLHPPEQPDEIGRLGGYRVLGIQGQGGMGVVFRAEDPQLKRQIALKAMKPVVAAGKSAKERFLREAQATAAIEHDNIVHIYQVGEDRDVPFIAMQFLRGQALQKRLQREGRLDQREVLRIGQEVAAGLTAAHKRELIHRDVKPENIWLEEETGRVKILDFGLVRTSTNDEGLTQTGAVLGTPRYMAPEQVLGQEVDHRCDLFSLGSVLYHLVSGKAPFDGPNLTATLIAVAHKDPEPIRRFCPDLDSGLAELIMRLLSKDPDRRPQSAKEVSEALSELEKKLESQTDRQQQAAEDTVATPPVPKRSKSHQRIVFGGSAVAVALAIVFGLWSAGIIFKVETNDGTLIVKVTGDDFAASVQGQKVTVKNAKTDDEYTIHLDSRENLRNLRPGKYFILETDSGLKTATWHFTISSGEEEVVEVSWEPKQQLAGSADNGWPGWPADAPRPAIAPFNAEQAKQYQQEWADYLGVSVERKIDLSGGEQLTIVLIPPGEFLMGSCEEEQQRFLEKCVADGMPATKILSEGPQHRVRITQPFYMGKHEVTQAQWQATTGSTPSRFQGKPTHPVEQVSWGDVQTFLAKLNESITAQEISFVLPTEAQWEFACRAGTTTYWPSGDGEVALREHAWFSANAGPTTRPARQLQPNAFGLHDTCGNVWEWCADWFAPSYAESRLNDPAGSASSLFRVHRGGAFDCQAVRCRSAFRGCRNVADAGHFTVGFRIAASIALPHPATKSKTAPSLFIAEAEPYPWPDNAPPPAIAPFGAEEAENHQQAWAEFLDLVVERSIDLGNGETLTLVLIPPGRFLMGSSKAEQASFLEGAEAVKDGYVRERIPSEGPQHWARITRPFYLGKYEVTQRQWETLMGNSPSHFKDSPSHPVEQIHWDDTQPFLSELNEICTDPELTLTLPTEAQWEYACRAGTTTMWHSGDSEVDLQDSAWFEANSAGRTHPVGQLLPNAFGLYDMHGNVWEWCADWYAADYYAKSMLNDPAGCLEGEFHVRRGGAWRCRAWSCRSAVRHDLTEGWYFVLGFRVAAAIELPVRPLATDTIDTP